MTSGGRPLEPQAFERLCDQLAAAVARCSDEQVLDLADSLHASLRRRRNAKAARRINEEQRSWIG
jgi:hypothetical protein